MTNKSDEMSDKNQTPKSSSESQKKQSANNESETQSSEHGQKAKSGFRPEDDLIAPNLSHLKKEPKEDVDKYKNDYLYLLAEFDNYKKNMIKERSDLLKFGSERLAYDLLNVLDIFEKALSTEATAEKFQAFKDGIDLTSLELKKTLEKHGIREIPSLGQNFDPNIHEALTHVPSKDHTDNTVMNVFKKGYKFHERTLRHSQVVVAKEVKETKEVKEDKD